VIAGANGVLGRATLPHLADHEVIGLTSTADALPLLETPGAAAVLCDVYD
jgi:nucleoside-diphosphate-sugar epimerase